MNLSSLFRLWLAFNAVVDQVKSLQPGETGAVLINPVAFGYKGTRYDVVGLSVKRAEAK